jgi:hypothetical protein
MSYWRQPQKRYEVQLAAGKALARLLAEAVPLLDAKSPGANRYMTLEWIELLKKTGAAYRSRKLPLLLRSRYPKIRRAAQEALRFSRR